MKKTGFIHRALALLLVVILTIQLLPVGTLAAFGDLRGGETGVDLSTLGQKDAINWPIKVYDYLSDGMLFEWMDTNTTTTSSKPNVTYNHTDGTAYVTPYGGGYKPPVTVLGSDFTYGTSVNYSISATENSPFYYYGANGKKYGKAYTLKGQDAEDYKTPYHLHITDGSDTSGYNMLLNYFYGGAATLGTARYMVLVYRANKVQNYYLDFSVSDDIGGTGWVRSDKYSLPDSTSWRYQIIDMYQMFGNQYFSYVWMTMRAGTTSSSAGGMVSNAYLDLTHIGYFTNLTEAENYGKEAVKFDKNPGEYLAHGTGNFTATHSIVTPANRADYLDHIFSLNYRWKEANKYPIIFGTDEVSQQYKKTWYGMDFTTHSTANGYKTNAYTSETFWSWTNGATLTLKNTLNNVTRAESFSMTRINVDQVTQANGAQYVRLTNSGPSKILLSKFREDHQLVQEGYVPLVADVDYMVMVYRTNGLTAADKFGLWAQGYLDSSSPDGHKTANQWGYAGLTKNPDWTTANNINQLSFSDDSGWQYQIIPLRETIGADDTNMMNIDRIANLGLYLPALTNGKSLDIAFVGYFKNNPKASDGMQFDTAVAFGQSAVNYMNAAATVTQDRNQSLSFGNNRVWNGGGNKSFGMLYSSGGGKYLPGTNSGGEATGSTVYEYGYDFDTWMIGYRTNAKSGDSFNQARYNLVWNANTQKYDKVKYTANYTGTSSGYDNLDFISNPSGTTNYIYFLAATEESATWGSNDGDDSNGKAFDTKNMNFDGYKLLETMVSGVMTAGLLEGGLQTVVVDGVSYRVPVYRQETVEYIAYNLLYGLRVPMRDANGNYNTRYIKGTESTKYGGVDLNGDGQIGWINYDGDSRNGNELNEASVDLATALRHELGMSARPGNSVNTIVVNGQVSAAHDDYTKLMGNYEQTLAKSQMLYGEFSDCRNAIDTAMDAAFYLLNNLFIANSYNQKQDDYDYLTLSSATVNALGHSGNAYVFDAGFTTGKTATVGTIFTDDGTNKSAISYSPYSQSGGTGTISMEGVTGKTNFDYGHETTSWTTRFPFLPITDAEGDFAGQTQSYYFLDDAQRIYTEGSNSYKDRNFNYVIASNGEFVYREEDDLFFEFEGDDDVYLFINGQLVLDIGGAHSITSVYIDVNDYVNAAAKDLEVLAQYGYNKDMSIDQFDQWISASNIEYLDEDLNPTGKTVANSYSASEKEYFKRQHRLNLSDGQICQFDFYYMERHGWGANCRIVTNMHITDPALNVEKEAFQYGEEIEYGGVIDPTSSVEYSFTLNNTGNTKLYNLTWRDDVLGITMDPTNGLTVDSKTNGIYVLDTGGGPLEAKDLVAIVRGKDANGDYGEYRITFDEVNGDGGQEALKRFLKKLESNDGTEAGFDDAEVTNAGSGLWVGASVQFRGMYYMLNHDQLNAGMVDNTVYLTATTKTEPSAAGNRVLRSDASHRMYTNGFPIHYQWAGHSIFMNLSHLLTEAKKEADREGSQLSLYQKFFKNITIGNLATAPCDKFGRVGGDYSDFLNKHTDQAGHTGYLINYDEPGIYVFYLLMYNKSYGSGVNANDIAEGDYAILRSQVFVADVEDSVYVLDYGLSTETLDANGAMFEGDYLFGPYGTIRAKLMGVTGTEPSFIDPVKQYDATMTGISFAAQDLLKDNRIHTDDGFYHVNLAIPETGKNIAYDSIKGEYTLTGVGTKTITAIVPENDGNWNTPYLYYWYNEGVTGPSWPGSPMKEISPGVFELDIPADVTNVIVNNGTAALKTEDLKISPDLDSLITVTVSGNKVTADIETIIENVEVVVRLHDNVGQNWQYLQVNYQQGNEWIEVEEGRAISNTEFAFEVPGNVTNLYLSNGTDKRTKEYTVYAGNNLWLDLYGDVLSEVTDADTGVVTSFYDMKVNYSVEGGYKVHAMVPDTWNDDVYIYYWHDGMTDDAMTWPGKKMTKGDLWYTLDELVPVEITHIIINDGSDGNNHQTGNLVITPGLETWVMVGNETAPDSEGNLRYTAKVHYGSESGSAGLTFTPQKFMDQENDMWLAITVHSTSANPSPLNQGINIHNEVQMYKKITVLPASVVYYEDCFNDIAYNRDAASTDNVFTRHGNGSGLLSQSVDRAQPYGQDAAYQGNANSLYSGDSLTAVQISDTGDVASFTFKGTGFELIGRTNAFDSASTVAWVYDAAAYAQYQADSSAAKPEALRIIPVVTQFDHGGDGGAESINQVPVIRATGLTHGEYTVVISGVPTYVFDAQNNRSEDPKKTYLYIDGLRIYEPMGATNEHYTAQENGAQILELRDQILQGNIAVGRLNGSNMTVSTALSSWTENLFDNDFNPSTPETFEGIIVGSADDYLIQGPNNEVYMEGNVTGGAVVFYVSKKPGSNVQDLQIAVRALDYGKFYGAGSTQLGAQLQFGVLLPSGNYGWKNLALVASGTEQYYTIPVSECPVDASGRYQVVLRAVEPQQNKAALVAYTNIKLNGLQIANLGDMGDSTIMYFENGIKISPVYYLNGTINGVTYSATTDTGEMDDVQFWDGKVSLTLDSAAVITIRRDMLKDTLIYAGQSDLGDSKSVTLHKDDASYGLNVPAGDVTFFLKQTEHGSLKLSYCLHSWNAGKVVKAPTCSHTGVKMLTCQNCGETKDVEMEINPVAHSYTDGECVLCEEKEPGFYLIGYINGSNYGCENDYANLGEYRFVDGKLTVKFRKDSYVFVKSENNADYYMTQTYDGNAKSAILYNTTTGSSEKLFVPGNVEVTFTLTQNPDGTLNLSYTHPCSHIWDSGVITTAPTCTDIGARVYTCGECGETKIEAIIPAGHNYVDHICSVCGEYEMMTIYFQNTAQWPAVYIWAWDIHHNSANYTGDVWPGAQMQPVAGEDGLYSYDVPVLTTHVIFSNGAGTQTSDLMIPTNGNNLYTYNGQWGLKLDELDYYLVGFINGVNYGCGADSDNLGRYKFVDGELVVTFQEDSYVFVKTTGNTTWYMTDVYDKNKESVNLFNTLTGASQKMFAPGGVELTFKLTVNNNGTLTLSYARPCEHAYDNGTQIKAPTCTADGLMTYTCTKCGDNYTTVLPSTGHDFTDNADTCGKCGEDRTQRIYFKNENGWGTVNIWAWSDGANYTGGNWPGKTMNYDTERGLYYFDLSVKAVNLLFNDGTGRQTSDMAVPTDDKVQFNSGSITWSTLGESIQIEYCLIGVIDGAYSGTDSDWENTISYRFTDSIVVTFTSDMNYLGVKTADNGSWYWASAYTTDSSCTFVQNGPQKWGVPAGTWRISLVKNQDGTITLSYEAYEEPAMYINNNSGLVLNLTSLSQQMNANTIYGEDEIF